MAKRKAASANDASHDKVARPISAKAPEPPRGGIPSNVTATNEGASPITKEQVNAMSNQPFSFSMDFNKIKGFENLPDGQYNAVITEAKPGTSEAGNTTLTLKWRVTDGEHEGRVIYDTLTFTEDAKWRVKAVCEALAPFQPDPETGEQWSGEITPELFIGEPAVITVALDTKSTGKINPKTGKPYEARARVGKVAPAGSLATFDDILASAE